MFNTAAHSDSLTNTVLLHSQTLTVFTLLGSEGMWFDLWPCPSPLSWQAAIFHRIPSWGKELPCFFKKKKKNKHSFTLLYLEKYNLSALKITFLFISESQMLSNACGTRMLHQLLNWTYLSSHIGTYPSLTGLEAGIESEQKTRYIIICNEFVFTLIVKMKPHICFTSWFLESESALFLYLQRTMTLLPS